ncbi:EAL and HDOD domain-containing protein [Persephonella sp.]
MGEVYVGRQPILNEKNEIFGYELLFRDSEQNYAVIKDNIEATARVILNLLVYMDFHKIIGSKKGFINVNPDMLEGDFIELLPPKYTVFEISNITKIDEYLISTCKNLKDKGYEIALDGLVYCDLISPFFDYIDYVKVSIHNSYEENDLSKTVKFLKKFDLKLIAQKVETEEDYLVAKELGFDYFQGFYFEKPEIYKDRQVSSFKLTLVKLLKAAITHEDLSKIEDIFKGNPDLGYKLLKFINSPFFYIRQNIKSIKQALSLLGYQNLQKWVLLQIFGLDWSDVKSNPILERAVIRGRMLEVLVEKSKAERDTHEKAFITGMLSLMDTVLGKPMEEILSELNLDQEIKDAIIENKGILGAVLKAIILLEKNELKEIRNVIKETGLGVEDVLTAEIEGIIFYENLINSY